MACVTFSNQAGAQTISGLVLDSATNQPISFVHIYDQLLGYGTTTNSDGEFEITLTRSGVPKSLTFSHIAYKSVQVTVTTDTTLALYLISDVITLGDVVVDGSAREVAEMVKQKLKEDFEQLKFAKSFYRQISKRDTTAFEWIESFVDVAYNSTGVKKFNIDQARYAGKKKKTPQDWYMSSRNHMYISYYSLYSPKSEKKSVAVPFSESQFDDYRFFVESKYLKGTDTLVNVSFSATASIDSELAPHGNFTFNLSKGLLFEVVIILDELGFEMSELPAGFPVKLRTENDRGNIRFMYTMDESNGLELIHSTVNYDFFVDDQVFPSMVESRLIFYEKLRKEPRKLVKPDSGTDFLGAFYNAKYRPNFWKDNPIIKLTREERMVIASFENDNAFGTFFKGKDK